MVEKDELVKPAGAPPTATTMGWRRTFDSLRDRNYRWYWLSSLAGFFAYQMQLVTQGWLVYEMTDSPLLLGVVTATWGLPVLFLSPLGGVIADRMEKRNLIVAAQTVLVLISLVLAILISTNAIQVWHLIAASFLNGVVFSLSMPARQTIIPELVGEERLMNAIALNSVGMNITRVVGPALAGVLIGLIGVSGVYIIITGCYVVTAGAMLMVSATGVAARMKKAGVIRDLVEGLAYVRWHSIVLMLLVVELVIELFGWPYLILMPVFARDVFGLGAAGLGMLMSITGVGALFGSLALAFLGDFRRKGLLLLSFIFLFGLGLALFSNSESLYLSLLFLFIVGGVSIGCFTLTNTLVQSNTAHEVRGRVMSIYTMTWSVETFGALPIGALAETVGVSLAVSAGGLFLALLAIVALILVPSLRRLE